jgi:hypothetical protein
MCYLDFGFVKTLTNDFARLFFIFFDSCNCAENVTIVNKSLLLDKVIMKFYSRCFRLFSSILTTVSAHGFLETGLVYISIINRFFFAAKRRPCC